MPTTRYKPEQSVTLLRQIEVAIANGKSTRQACKEAQITARGRVNLGHAQACGTEVVRGDQPLTVCVGKAQE